MRERHVLRAWPLTPIHVGAGKELTPESYVLEGDRLRTFNSFAALSAASDAEREHYQKLLKGGDFIGAQRRLASLAKPSSVLDETIAVSKDSLSDLKKVLNGETLGRGGVRPFIRDGGAPILPGSSLKGALRTAWIDQAMAEAGKQSRAPQPNDPKRTGIEAREVNNLALDIESKILEQDPFRDVAVVDAPIPPGRTRYDRATLGKLDREGRKLNFDQTGGIQMHVERLISLADGGAVAPFDVAIDLATGAFVARRERMGQRQTRRIVPKRPIDAASLWAAANRFHADLWRYERRRFYEDGRTGPLLDGLLKAFGLTGDEGLASQLDAKGFVLLRVGRYGQFESKAARLNGRRYGVKAAAKGMQARFMDEGGTRTTVKVANEIEAPFGWLLMAPPGMGPQGAVSASRPGVAAQLRFRKGEPVVHDDLGEGAAARDVSETDARMLIDFDGELEEHPVQGWRRK